MWRHRALRVVSLGFVGIAFCTAIDDVALVFLATDSLQAGPSGASSVYAAVGIGLLIGFAILGRVAEQLPTAALLVAGYAVSSLATALTGLAWALAAAFGFQLIRGVTASMMDVGHNTLLQRIVPPHLLGRAFSNLYGMVGIAAGLSYIAGSLLLSATNPRVTFVVGGIGGLAVAAVVAVRLPRALRLSRALRAPAPKPAPAPETAPAEPTIPLRDPIG